MTSEADYGRQWRDLRMRSRLLLLLFVFYIPVMALSVFALNGISPGLGDQSWFWLFAGWMVVLIVLGFYQISFRCPHCGGWFGSSDSWNNPIAGHCLHCGQKRYGAPGHLR